MTHFGKCHSRWHRTHRPSIDSLQSLATIFLKLFVICFIFNVPTLAASTEAASATSELDCGLGTSLTFELITGQVYTSPADTVTMIPGVLHLSECLSHCRANQTCKSLNFETGLCVLLSSSALQRPFALTPSQFPVFTIYAHKICLAGLDSSCMEAGWAFERVRGFELREHEKKMVLVDSRLHCMQACVQERDFQCRSVNYEEESRECWLSEMNRHTVNSNTELRTKKYGTSTNSVDYLEYNCVNEPKKMCDFKQMEGKILKTVDSVYQNVKNLSECQQMCLNGPYRCRSYDFGDPSNPVCRTSHLDKLSLSHVENPYIEIGGAVTYELQNCYDVAIQCRAQEMIAKVRSSRLFDGKVYAKHKPHHCMTDVTDSLEFEIHMNYNDLECDVQQPNKGQYSNDIVIQHHDMIVTTQDLGLNINCNYDLANKSISNDFNLDINDYLQPIGTHSAVVESPNVTMRIVNQDGASVRSAKVGDSLVLRFEISDTSSPFELFVRELVAVDGSDLSEFVLIDTDGCPTDLTIMKPIEKRADDGHVLETSFEAFKFPTSELVQFRALITPCVANCQPFKCNLNLPSGRTSQTLSYGRRRKREAANNADDSLDNVIVVESLSVTDKFNSQARGKKIDTNDNLEIYENFDDDDIRLRTSRIHLSSACINTISVILFAVVFLIGQAILLVTWSILWNRKPKNSLIDNEMLYGIPSGTWSTGRASLPAKDYNLYSDSTMMFARRHQPSIVYS